MTQTRLSIDLPASLTAERRGDIAILRLSRPQKRNALDDTTVNGIESFFAALPDDIRAVVLHGEGEHFSAGLDLGELTVRNTVEAVHHSRNWHRIFDRLEFGKVPVVAVLHGAVVGGGGSVRIPRLIGVARMMDMMLTGRTYGADEGLTMGISQYLVDDGTGLAKGIELAQHIAGNTPLTNYAVMHVLPRIADIERDGGYLMESLMAAIASGNEDAQQRLKDFLEKRAPKALHKK